MKIAIITYQFPPNIGGMQKWNEQMAEAYVKVGHQVDVYHLQVGSGPHPPSSYAYHAVPVDTRLDVSQCRGQKSDLNLVVKSVLFVFAHLPTLCRSDVWQVTYGEPIILRLLITIASCLCSKKLIAVSGCVIFRHPYRNPLSRQLKFFLARLTLHRASLILVDGADIKKEITGQGIKARKVHVCYAGVDTGLFKPVKHNDIINEIGALCGKPISPSKLKILYCCRFSPENAPDRFLDAIDNREDVDAIMVGDGPLMPDIKKRCALMTTPVFLPGALPYQRLPALFSNIDICLYPFSRYIGGISQVIPLSMSCGAIVITTDIGDNRALIRHGANGFLTGETDIPSIIKIIDGYRDRTFDPAILRTEARATIVRDWSIERTIEEYRKRLESIADHG